jgi:hypothetical protein
VGRDCQIGTRKNKIKGISFVMGDFSQNGIISNLHDFGTKTTADIEKELLKFSKERKMELILPSLYSELKGDALPNIVKQIEKQNI